MFWKKKNQFEARGPRKLECVSALYPEIPLAQAFSPHGGSHRAHREMDKHTRTRTNRQSEEMDRWTNGQMEKGKDGWTKNIGQMDKGKDGQINKGKNGQVDKGKDGWMDRSTRDHRQVGVNCSGYQNRTDIFRESRNFELSMQNSPDEIEMWFWNTKNTIDTLKPTHLVLWARIPVNPDVRASKSSSNAGAARILSQIQDSGSDREIICVELGREYLGSQVEVIWIPTRCAQQLSRGLWRVPNRIPHLYTNLSTPRQRYWVPKINNISAE